MATLVNGKFTQDSIVKLSRNGEFERPESVFRDCISKHEAEPNRYHLYVSYACPWAHRTLIVRNIKKLQNIIGISVTDAYMGEKGWSFKNEGDHPKLLADLYLETDKTYTGKVTVPVFWDKKERVIINNESSEIIRILNSAFDDLTDSTIDLYPEHLQEAINDINARIYEHVNNGVYKAGFAGGQRAYEIAFDKLFETLDELDDILGRQKFLTGNYLTEADIRLFTTLIRFDSVYYVHFKCNKKRIVDYRHLYPYMKMIYQMPEVKTTCRFDHIKEHYFKSHSWINPTRIVPKGPEMDLDSPHDRREVKFWYKHH